MTTNTAEKQKPAQPVPVIDLAKPAQLVFTAQETSDRLGRIVSAFWLERQAAARAIQCTYIGGHLGFTETQIQWLIEQNVCDPGNYGRKAS